MATYHRVALAQMNSCVGAFEHNGERILAFVQKAVQEGARLVVFPELAFSSYPCLDLVDRADFRTQHEDHLRALIKAIAVLLPQNALVVLGAFTDNTAGKGRLMRNSAMVVSSFGVQYVQHKQLLPTYDVFDENRYFEPGPPVAPWVSPLGSLGLSICEDAWFSDLHTGRLLYNADPALQIAGCELAVNISASPFALGKKEKRNEVIGAFAGRVKAPLLYVNQVGANDEILFDGDSRIYNGQGTLVVNAPSFTEGLLVCDIAPVTGKVRDPKFFLTTSAVLKPVTHWQNAPALLSLADEVEWTTDPRLIPPPGRLRAVTAETEPAVPPPSGRVGKPLPLASSSEDELRRLARGLECGIRDYFSKTGFTKAVLGLSGGIDSAVVATLAARALGPSNVYGITMPSKYTSSSSLEDAAALAESLGIEFGAASIKFVNSALLMELKPHFKGAPEDVTEENLQSRLRGVIAMAVANKRGALVLTTGNKSEIAVGYCTLYGDMCGALAPLGDIYKTKVYELAHYLNTEGNVIPQSTLTKAPSAELRPGQTDQDSLPDYGTLDRLLTAHIEQGQGKDDLLRQGFDAAVVEQVLRLVRLSEFKRGQAAPVLKVTPKAFGMGRRYPIVRGF